MTDDATPIRRGWWRSNLLSLGVLAVLLPATVLGIGWWKWDHAFPGSGQPVWAVEPGKSGTVELQGATWGPVRSKEVADTSGLDMPPNAKLILVGVPVDPTGDKGPGCWSPKLVQKSTGRVWLSARTELGLLWNDDEPEDCVPTLEGEKAERYELVLPYVVPDDVEGPFWVDLEPLSAKSKYVRFSIDP
ncbi:hypothetical protein [Microbacterium azadirachtae]|uniref:hypothetical protein n=1 Tax=Microbacterium azadirachtae TaxID=582680 RepID=UPI00088C4331|nr:hypothetical protein [Microbacterium azadirachtae]SDM16136.1 hypothetical protein SAMN04488593_2795 [Microbacterium azadirachtae]SEG39463.1 hypothetical protein SAMN04488594_2780 [Microbacterium azadirachtae]SEG42506.1 hypothetical protein SAMN04488592_2789 [Microbacterium azadirachtae]